MQDVAFNYVNNNKCGFFWALLHWVNSHRRAGAGVYSNWRLKCNVHTSFGPQMYRQSMCACMSHDHMMTKQFLHWLISENICDSHYAKTGKDKWNKVVSLCQRSEEREDAHTQPQTSTQSLQMLSFLFKVQRELDVVLTNPGWIEQMNKGLRWWVLQSRQLSLLRLKTLLQRRLLALWVITFWLRHTLVFILTHTLVTHKHCRSLNKGCTS